MALPVDRVEPTPYQRDPSDAHVKRLMGVIETIGRFLDPIIAVREDGHYLTPNGNHRLQALKKLGVKTVIALLVPDAAVAFKILALNTEKSAQPPREVARNHPDGEGTGDAGRYEGPRRDHLLVRFEQPAFLTLGIAYEQRPRLSGGAYQSILRRVDVFLDEPIAKAIKERERRGRKILKLDDAVSAAVEKLKAKGLTSPYLKPFVVSRVNYTRFSKATSFRFRLRRSTRSSPARRSSTSTASSREDVAKSGGGAPDEE